MANVASGVVLAVWALLGEILRVDLSRLISDQPIVLKLAQTSPLGGSSNNIEGELMSSHKKHSKVLALLFGAALVVAACGGDDDAVTTEAPTSEAPTSEAPTSEEPTGEPFKIGVQNLEGDPNGSFPEFSIAIQAAADYVNAELGGLGGRPIEIVLCKSIVSPDDSQRCANELSAEGVDLAISTINFFGNHYSIYRGAGIPVLAVTPITIADFTSEGVFAIGA